MITPSAGDESGTAAGFAAFLQDLGITHLVTVPDNTSAPILSVLARDQVDSPDGSAPLRFPRLLFATREGEAMGLASGIWLGGGMPAVLIQNTGLLEAGDGLRGTASRMGVPLLLMVTCRGYPKARLAGLDPGKGEVDRDVLVRADLDSVAHMTEATLRAWGVPFHFLRNPSDLGPLRDAHERARDEGRPVAVLVDASFA